MIERAVVEAASHLRREAEPYLIATVISGSGYRTPGSHALITRDRWVAGSVSSGDLVRASVVDRAWQRAAGDPVLIRDADRDDADDAMLVGLRLGCCSELDVLLERADKTRLDPFAIAERCVDQQRRGAIATVIGTPSQRLPIGSRMAIAGDDILCDEAVEPLRERILADLRQVVTRGDAAQTIVKTYGDVRVMYESLVPPPRLFVFGDGHDVVPVAGFAHALGWDVVTCGKKPLPSPATIDAADTPVAIVMHHDLERDRDALVMLLQTRARYIGVHGSRERLAGMNLGAFEIDSRVASPIGLDLGAATPEAMALSIIAEVQAVLAGGSGMRSKVANTEAPTLVAL